MPLHQAATILTVDANAANRTSLTHELGQAGFRVRSAATGREALRLVAEQPDLIVLELDLPDVPGPEVCRQLKARPATAGIPLLCLAGASFDSSSRAALLENGVEAVLARPVEPRELVAWIRALLQTHQTGKVLHQAAEGWRTLFDTIRDGIFLLDAAGRVRRCNHAAADLLGRPFTKIIDHPFADLLPPTVQAPDPAEALLTSNFGRCHEALEWQWDDSWYRVTIAPLPAPGDQAAAVCTLTDITTCKQAEEERQRYAGQLAEKGRTEAAVQAALQQANREKDEALALLDTLVRSAPVGIAFLDRDMRYRLINQRLAEINGAAVEAHLGRTVAEMLPRLAPVLEPLFRQALSGSPVVNHEVIGSTHHSPDEARVWLESWYPVSARVGAPMGVGVIVQEITERKRVEEALKEADQHKDHFLAMLAHELRNPLAPICSAVQSLQLMELSDPTLRQARDLIDRQAAHMARLVDDLLDVSRIACGKILLRKDRCELSQIVRATTEDYRAALEKNGLRLIVQLPEQPLWVLGDAIRLAQIVGNVLHNAGKFTDAGGQVLVHLAADTTGQAAVLGIRDTGIGMEPEMLGRVFDAFCQADRSKERSRGGLGMGLALVRGLVELHGGEVHAASAGPGRGTEFTIRLPLWETEGHPQWADDRATRPSESGPSYRMLIIEDNHDTAESMKMLLGLLGHQAEIAATGPIGLEAARRLRPQVILCDIGLPGGMNGYEVAQRLRQESELAQTPLIALTGYGQDEDRRKALAAGFDVHLTKPVDLRNLQRMLSELMVGT